MENEMGALLVIGSGYQPYREYILEALARSAPVVLLQEAPMTWQAPYVCDIRCAPSIDVQAVLAAAHELDRQHRLAGVLTYDETAVELTALIATELGLPTHSPAAARRCRDKLASRRALALAGVPSARSVLVRSLSEAGVAAQEIGYPVVLKPRALAASMGVVMAESPADLAAAFDIAECTTHPLFHSASGVLLEEYLDGPEVSVESVVFEGRVRPIAVTRKEVGFTPYFEELGHTVSTVDDLPNAEAIYSVAIAAQQALELTCGITHTELRLTRSGPRIVEVNARLGGDLIPRLVEIAAGISLPEAASAVARGHQPQLEPTRHRAASIRFFYPGHDGIVSRLAIDPAIIDSEWLEQLTWLSRPGDELRLPPRGFVSRLGFAIVSGVDAAACRRRQAELESRMHMELAPITAVAA
jgi:biotin carboxylase